MDPLGGAAIAYRPRIAEQYRPYPTIATHL